MLFKEIMKGSIKEFNQDLILQALKTALKQNLNDSKENKKNSFRNNIFVLCVGATFLEGTMAFMSTSKTSIMTHQSLMKFARFALRDQAGIKTIEAWIYLVIFM
jgi:hypothetical protein